MRKLQFSNFFFLSFFNWSISWTCDLWWINSCKWSGYLFSWKQISW